VSPAETAAVVPGRGQAATIKLSLMRRAMVRSSVAGAAVPVFYLRARADVTDLVAARRASRETGGAPRATINDAVVHAVAAALRAHPRVNSSYGDNTIDLHARVNVGVAIAVDDGLVVPTIYDADTLSVGEIGAASRDLATLAHTRKLSREVLADSTFAVSNLGMFGIEDFDPLINPPHAGILGVGAAADHVGGRLLMALTLGCDHRVLTGAEGAVFLGDVKAGLERGAELFAPAATG
jgi:pyruvate dehydrogenase E2 component (dihydrolipoamide acetyltransferase)